MINKLNRFIPEGYMPVESSHEYKNHERKVIEEKSINNKIEYLNSMEEVFKKLNITGGMTLSFHHHLRNGDYVQNMVSEEILKQDLKNIHYALVQFFQAIKFYLN